MALGDLEGVENDYVPGAEVRALGWSLWLDATGDFAGQRYRVERMSDERAVSHLMASTNARMQRRENAKMRRHKDAKRQRPKGANIARTQYIFSVQDGKTQRRKDANTHRRDP